MNRELSLDYLKVISLLGLVVAHVSSNTFLLQLRSFDVNLLVIISAILAEEGFKRNNTGETYTIRSIKLYYIKRFNRLVLPTWIFITLYLVFNMLFKFQNYSLKQIVNSYLFQDNSIGYVWIIYVYCICAVVMPFLYKVDLRVKKHCAAFFVVLLMYVLMYKLVDSSIFMVLVLYPVIYSLISIIGVNYKRVSTRIWWITSLVLFILFSVIAIYLMVTNHAFIKTGSYKYPPQIYYLTYSIGSSLFLLNIADYIKNRRATRGVLLS